MMLTRPPFICTLLSNIKLYSRELISTGIVPKSRGSIVEDEASKFHMHVHVHVWRNLCLIADSSVKGGGGGEGISHVFECFSTLLFSPLYALWIEIL